MMMLRFSLLICLVAFAYLFQTTSAFPKRRAINSSQTEFSRKRVVLHDSAAGGVNAVGNDDSSPLTSRRQMLLKVDAVTGILFSAGGFLFPGQIVSLFLKHECEPSIQAFLHVAVRLIAINHLGYVVGLLMAPPEKATRVATVFLTVVGGIFTVYCSKTNLETAALFWSCTLLTTVLIIVHLLSF